MRLSYFVMVMRGMDVYLMVEKTDEIQLQYI